MWFPTMSQNILESKMPTIKKYFIEYYGEKYKDKIEKKFNEFVYVVTHNGLTFEESHFDMLDLDVKTKYMQEFLRKIGIKEELSGFEIKELYDCLLDKDINGFINRLANSTKVNINRAPLRLKLQLHIKDLRDMLANSQKEMQKASGRQDFLSLKAIIDKFRMQFLKEVYDILPSSSKEILDDTTLSDGEKLHKLYFFVPFLSFNSSTFEFYCEDFGLDYANKQFRISDSEVLTREAYEKFHNVRIRFEAKLNNYFKDTCNEYLRICTTRKGFEFDGSTSDQFASICLLKKVPKGDSETLFSTITYNLPLDDFACVHEINHHAESYIDKDGVGISGWRPITQSNKKYICNSMLFDEVINDLITDDIIKLMNDDGFYILEPDTQNTCDYTPFKSIVERFFIEFKDLIIESRMGENPNALYDGLGIKNVRDLDNLFIDMIENNEGSLEVDEEFIMKYQKEANVIVDRMIEYRRGRK